MRARKFGRFGNPGAEHPSSGAGHPARLDGGDGQRGMFLSCCLAVKSLLLPQLHQGRLSLASQGISPSRCAPGAGHSFFGTLQEHFKKEKKEKRVRKKKIKRTEAGGNFSPVCSPLPACSRDGAGGDFPSGSQGCAWLPELRACGMLGETLPSAAQHGHASAPPPAPYGHLPWVRAPAVGCFTRTPVLWGQRAGSGKPLSRLQFSPAASCCPAVLHSLEKEPGFVPRLPRFLPAAVSPGCSFRDRFFQILGPGCRARCCRVAAIGAPVAAFPQTPPNLQLGWISRRFPVLRGGASSPNRGGLIIQGSLLDIWEGENIQVFVPGVPEINNCRERGRVEPVSEGNQGNAMTAALLRFLRSPAHGNF